MWVTRWGSGLVGVLLVVGCGGGDGGDPPMNDALTLVALATPPTTAEARSELGALVVEVTHGGAPVAGLQVDFEVTAGGGRADPPGATTDAAGQATVRWTLGMAPVGNRLEVRIPQAAPLAFTVAAQPTYPIAPAPFGDVDAFLTAEGVAGSTEGLAFDGLDRLVLGVPGGLIAVDPAGVTSRIPLTGDALATPLGLAFDAAGVLWVADSDGAALRRVARDGTVTTPLTEVDGAPLGLPNAVAIGPDGHVHLSDSCRAQVFRFDPVAGAVVASHAFVEGAEGGANGLAFDGAGRWLYATTENIALLCGGSAAGPTDPVAGLYRLEVTASGYGAREAVAEGVGLFGDGLAFDAEGHLHVIFDTVDGLALADSAVYVLPAGGSALAKYLATTDVILANPAFGRGPSYGVGTMYLALLAVPPFTDASARGLMKVHVGLDGAPLPW